MLVAAKATGRKTFRDVAKQSMQFLTDTLVVKDRLEIIGNNGWYLRGGERAWYDQQSVDAGYTVYLFCKAYELWGIQEFLDLAKTAFGWFFGNNRSAVWVYEPETKGCYDAITPWGLNLNQGAEASICCLLAQLAMANSEGTAGK